MKQLLTLLFILLIITSCFKEDVKINPPKPGNINTVTIEIGYPYLNQVYYNCEQNKIISTNTKYDWDLAFECGTNGYHIKMNTAKGILTSNQGSSNFNSVSSASGVEWQWDNSNGNLNDTGIGEWFDFQQDQSLGFTYIIDLKYDIGGANLGYKKVNFLTVTDTTYTFKFANLDGTNEITYTIKKDNSVNFICFTFANGGKTKHIEPNKTDWDLCFTNYQHKFSNLPLPFVITGVLSNKYSGVIVAEDTLNNFTTLTLKDTVNYTFTNKLDEIGYDWKIRNSADNSFTIDEQKSFLIRNQNGLYFKLRFIDFYNETGSKGYPKFEIQKL